MTNYEMFKKYLDILHPDGKNNIACYGEGQPINLKGVEATPELFEQLKGYNDEGYDIYTVVQTATGFKDHEVTGCRWYIADWDAGRDADGNYLSDEEVQKVKVAKWIEFKQLVKDGKMLKPTMVIESRNGFHLYWMSSDPQSVSWEGSLEDDFDKADTYTAMNIYRATILSIAKHLGTDTGIFNPGRVLRIAATDWKKTTEGLPSVLTTIKYCDKTISYTPKEIIDAFPLDDECIALATDKKRISSSKSRSSHSGGGGSVSAGTWFIVHNNGSKSADGKSWIEVTGTDDKGQIHAACPIGNDPNGHDLVIRPGNWAYCNADGCHCGCYATENKDDIYEVKKESMWNEINSAETYDALSSDNLAQIQSHLTYKQDERTVEEWFSNRNVDGGSALDAWVTGGSDIDDTDIDGSDSVSIPMKAGAIIAPIEPPPALIVTPDVLVPDVDDLDTDEWLDKILDKHYDFPMAGMPDPARRFIENAVLQKGILPEYFATGILAIFAGAISSKYKIQLDKSWSQPPILWIVNLAPTGFKKTSCFEKVWSIADEKIDLTTLSNIKKQRAYETAMAKFTHNPNGTGSKMPSKPSILMIKCGDITYQYLGKLFSKSPFGTTASRDEIIGVLKGISEKDKGSVSARAFMLESYDGGRIVIGRSGEGEQYVYHNHMSIYGFSQEKIFAEMLKHEANIDDGFLPRMLIVNPPEQKMCKDTGMETDQASLDILKNAYSQLIDTTPLFGDEEHRQVIAEKVYLDDEAQAYWDKLEARHEALTDKLFFEKDHWFRPWWNKYQGQVGRLAFVIHMLKRSCGQANEKVDIDSFKAAHEMGKYFLSNSYKLVKKTIHGDGPGEYVKEYKKIDRWIKRNMQPISLRQILRSNIFANDEVRDKALKVYVDTQHGIIIEMGVKKVKHFICLNGN